ncbi:putative RNA-directed DNA polymerase [Helianthus anomalus]
MDSGASFHATHISEALGNLKIGDFGKVRLANDEVLDVTSMGDLDLKTPVGSWTLKDVRVIPSLKKQLISVGQLDEQGQEVKFKNGQWKVIKGNLVVARGKKQGSLYMVSLPSEGVTVPVQKKTKIRFTESRGQKKVCFAGDKPRATNQIQVERARKGSEKPVKSIRGSGSTGSASVRAPRRQWVKRTSIPAVKVSPVDYLLYSESVCSQDVPGSGSSCQWEPIGTENESRVVTDELKLSGSFNLQFSKENEERRDGKAKVHIPLVKENREIGHNKQNFNRFGNFLSSANIYAGIVSGNHQGIASKKGVVVSEYAKAFVELHGLAIIGKTKDLWTLRKLNIYLKEANFGDSTIKYLGGMNVLIVFKSSLVADNFRSNAPGFGWFISVEI